MWIQKLILWKLVTASRWKNIFPARITSTLYSAIHDSSNNKLRVVHRHTNKLAYSHHPHSHHHHSINFIVSLSLSLYTYWSSTIGWRWCAIFPISRLFIAAAIVTHRQENHSPSSPFSSQVWHYTTSDCYHFVQSTQTMLSLIHSHPCVSNVSTIFHSPRHPQHNINNNNNLYSIRGNVHSVEHIQCRLNATADWIIFCISFQSNSITEKKIREFHVWTNQLIRFNDNNNKKKSIRNNSNNNI